SGSQRSGEQSYQKLFLAQCPLLGRKGVYSVHKHIRPHRRTRKFIYANRKLTILCITQDGQLFIFTVFACLFSFSDSAAASLAIHLALATQRYHLQAYYFRDEMLGSKPAANGSNENDPALLTFLNRALQKKASLRLKTVVLLFSGCPMILCSAQQIIG
ncbi:MAG: hypothetical protein RR951_11130, partial [Ruthenibacterium sp.]